MARRWRNTPKGKKYCLDGILSLKCFYNIIFGGRNNGKSYAVKERAIKHFYSTGGKFLYVRRYEKDITIALAEQYFGDTPIEEYSNGRHNTIFVKSGKVYAAHYDIETDKTSDTVHIGYVRALSMAQRYSSGAYPDVDIVILEEFAAIELTYLPNEIFKFKHLISTVAREREIEVFLISNTVSRICPYFREFGIHDIRTLEQGALKVYEIANEDGTVTRIAVEFCEPLDSQKTSMSFGQDRGMTVKGKWLTREMPKVDIDGYDSVYKFVVEWDETRFLVEYMVKDDNYLLYVQPKTTPIKEDTRVFSNRPSPNPHHTKGLVPLSKAENDLLKMMSYKTFYSDNLTGTEFIEVINKLKIM